MAKVSQYQRITTLTGDEKLLGVQGTGTGVVTPKDLAAFAAVEVGAVTLTAVEQIVAPKADRDTVNYQLSQKADTTYVQEQISILADGQAVGQLVYRTWAELSAVTGAVGQGAQVTESSGTHADPVTGATVPNGGQYVWSASPAGWRWDRPDALALKADRSVVDVLSVLTVSTADLLSSPSGRAIVRSDNAAAASATVSAVVGGLSLQTGSTTVTALLELFGLSLQAGVRARLSQTITVTAIASGTPRGGLSFGPTGATRRHVNIRTDGTLYTTLDDFSTATVIAAAVPELVHGVGDAVQCAYDWDGSVLTLTITTPAGGPRTFSIPDIVPGPVWANQTANGTQTFSSVTLERLTGMQRSIVGKLEGDADAAKAAVVLSGYVQPAADIVAAGFRATNGDTVTGTSLSVSGSDLLIDTTTSTNRAISIPTDLVAPDGGGFRADLEWEVTALTGASSVNMGLSFGNAGAGRLHYTWRTVGDVLVYDDDANLVATLIGTGASRGWALGDECRLSARRDASGRMELLAFVNGVHIFTVNATGVPAGPVGLFTRTAPIVVRKVTAMTGGGYNSVVAEALRALPQGTHAKLIRQDAVPDGAQAQNANGGFTCTGADQVGPSGAWAGCWVVGNDGRVFEGSSVHTPSIVLLSPDRRRILREWDMSGIAGIQSIQGVAWDSSDDTIWFVDKTNGMIRHLSFSGALLPDPIPAPAGATINGIAYQPALDALWVHHEGVKLASLISCADGTTVLGTLTSLTAQADQFGYDNDRGWLYYSVGNNGVDGQIHVVDVATDKVIAIVTLPGSQAIEGIKLSTSGTLVTFNDGAFHTSAKPPLALSCEYAFGVAT